MHLRRGQRGLNASLVAKDVAGDAAFVSAMGFDGLKADGCGPGRDLPALAAQLRESCVGSGRRSSAMTRIPPRKHV